MTFIIICVENFINMEILYVIIYYIFLCNSILYNKINDAIQG